MAVSKTAMQRKPVEWLGAPDDDQDYPPDGYELIFRAAAEWVAVDADQLILPITLIDKSTITVNEPYSCILKQYGGEGLLNDLLMADQDFEEGSTWVLIRNESLLTIEPLPDYPD